MLVMEAERFGGPQVLTARQVPDPTAWPGQVVMRTSAADLLFVPLPAAPPTRFVGSFGCPDTRNCRQSCFHPSSPPNLLSPDLSV
ncbi:MAG: hypothetical protein ACRDPF_18025 [Streptosporangiaceae bacterium]